MLALCYYALHAPIFVHKFDTTMHLVCKLGHMFEMAPFDIAKTTHLFRKSSSNSSNNIIACNMDEIQALNSMKLCWTCKYAHD
jgi:hypothetical protein